MNTLAWERITRLEKEVSSLKKEIMHETLAPGWSYSAREQREAANHGLRWSEEEGKDMFWRFQSLIGYWSLKHKRTRQGVRIKLLRLLKENYPEDWEFGKEITLMYTKDFNPEKYKEIEHVLKDLQSLQPGEELRLEGMGQPTGGSIRWLIYDWLFHMGLKRQFRIKTGRKEGDLLIWRIGLPPGTKITLQRDVLTSDLEGRLVQLVPLERTQAEETIGRWLAEGAIRFADAEQLLASYDEVMK